MRRSPGDRESLVWVGAWEDESPFGEVHGFIAIYGGARFAIRHREPKGARARNHSRATVRQPTGPFDTSFRPREGAPRSKV